MKQYSETVWKQLSDLKASLVDSHKQCNGSGYLSESDNRIVTPCKCIIVFRFLKELITAGIPSEYWPLDYREFEIDESYKKLVSFFIKHFKAATAKSLGILYMGENGVGKTAMMCEIGKYAVVYGLKVQYFTIEEYVNTIRTGKVEILDQFESADVLLVDELGKVYEREGSTFVTNAVESFFRRCVTKKIVIASTNFNEKELGEYLGDSTLSVIKRHLKMVEVAGSDYSHKLHDRWKASLDDSVDYMKNENIYRLASFKEGRSLNSK